MKSRAILALLTMAVLLGGCSMNHKDSEADETKVPMEQVPAAVRATFAREAPGVTITSVDLEKDDNKTVYEADAVIGGKNYAIKIAPDGSLISKTEDNEAAEKAGDTPKK